MATPNGLNPYFERVELRGGAILTGGIYSTDGSIRADVGYLPKGSLYFCNSTSSGAVFCMQASIWTQISIN